MAQSKGYFRQNGFIPSKDGKRRAKPPPLFMFLNVRQIQIYIFHRQKDDDDDNKRNYCCRENAYLH